ncbi:MAG: helix-turn-helix domain-containing protein [Acidimicrobiia bacterium]|nr:helix-turn-helix domain-containing protein [Acidimicrobiia bacterium]MBV9042273.1 helix-turn-helix domain-containing protein [Acidimicrobiia bacterium]MBV9284237.1 helix-turn-helix domain-containing protein [Acidimicrobiia bacterium]
MTPRPAPGAERVVAVLNFLAAHPDESFSLSELARRLDLNKATCHALLMTLTEAGYLLRHPTRMTYMLGPALVAIGGAAQGQFQAVDFAREEMRTLAEETSLECIASTVVGDEIVILSRSGAALPFGASVALGQRLPLVPPLGSVFMAWAAPDDIDGWLQRQHSWASEEQLDRYQAALTAVRRRGYAVSLSADARLQVGQALASLGDEGRSQPVRGMLERLLDDLSREDYFLIEVEPGTEYRVNTMGAPVFGPTGSVELGLFLVGFRGVLRGEDVIEYGERLAQATRNVTKAIHGEEPQRA